MKIALVICEWVLVVLALVSAFAGEHALAAYDMAVACWLAIGNNNPQASEGETR